MEPKDEPKNILKKEKSEEKTINKKTSSDKSEENTINKIKFLSNNQFNQLELNNEHFQILQQKEQKEEKDEDEFNRQDILNKHKALSDKDIVNIKNNIEKNNSQTQLKEIKETYKKSRSQDNSQANYKYYYRNDDNNKNVSSLLDYYKDIDLNFKDKNVNNHGKNFLRKNQFQELNGYNYKDNNYNSNDNNNNRFNNQNTYQYNYPFMPYYYYPNLYYMNNNNQNNFSYNIENNNSNSNQFPDNVFSINNHINYHLSNNINYFNYNYFHKNKFKRNNKYSNNNNIDDHKLYIVNIENILKGDENRTTIMIRHIPNRYTYQTLQDEINAVCKDKYDCLYLPIDSESNCNLGYAFINFINPLHIVRFYEMFKSRKWLCFNSFKECDLSFAKFQGKTALTSNYEKNLNNINIDKRKIPMIFDIKYPPKIDLPKKYYEMIKEYRTDIMKDINWI